MPLSNWATGLQRPPVQESFKTGLSFPMYKNTHPKCFIVTKAGQGGLPDELRGGSADQEELLRSVFIVSGIDGTGCRPGESR